MKIPMTPEGVEHSIREIPEAVDGDVKIPMTPEGVEHIQPRRPPAANLSGEDSYDAGRR